MFIGSVPRDVVDRVTRLLPWDTIHTVFVCCSGAFRIEQAVRAAAPHVRIEGSDVSLFSCALGELATGRAPSFRFRERLAFLEDILAEPAYSTPAARAGALLLAQEMSRYARASAYDAAYWSHYADHARDFITKTLPRLEAFSEATRLDDFHARDFRLHALEGIAAGAAIIGFPPTYKGGYERLYKFLDANAVWSPPPYEVWDPKDLAGWISELDGAGAVYAIGTDQMLPERSPSVLYANGRAKPVYAYTRLPGAGLVVSGPKAEPFPFRVVTEADLVPESDVAIAPATSGQMTYLKDIYLSKHIKHAPGIWNFLVYINGNLAGGIILAPGKYKRDDLYLLSDFAVTRKHRVSKLIASLATSRAVIRRAEVQMLRRYRTVSTTAFTDRPVSMKYRGVFTLTSRGEGHLNYTSEIREASPEALYRAWLTKGKR